jgi:membrane-bound lytic murein transglycosylase D
MKRLFLAGSFISGMIACMFIFCLLGFEDEPVKTKNSIAAANTHPAPPLLPASISFAGEAVPLQRQDTREQLDRELLYNYYQPGTIYYLLKLANRYFPQIEAQLKANNIPDDFKYLCVAESNLQNLVSKAGASGFWQFMK